MKLVLLSSLAVLAGLAAAIASPVTPGTAPGNAIGFSFTPSPPEPGSILQSNYSYSLFKSSTRLQRRFEKDAFASDDQWTKAVCNGNRFLTGMLGTDEEAAKPWDKTTMRSPWQGDLRGEHISPIAPSPNSGSSTRFVSC